MRIWHFSINHLSPQPTTVGAMKTAETGTHHIALGKPSVPLILSIILVGLAGTGCQTFTLTEEEFEKQRRKWATEPVTGFGYSGGWQPASK